MHRAISINYHKKFNTVTVEARGKYQIVYVGPMQTSAEAQTLSRKIHGFVIKKRQEPINNQVVDYHDKNNAAVMPLSDTKHQAAEYLDKDAAIMPIINSSHFEIIGSPGIANLRADNSFLGVTSNETDLLVQTNRNDWNTFTGQVGLGYVYYFPGAVQYADPVQWFPAIEPQINGYYIGTGTLKGNVWRFGSSAFNEMTFKMPIQSTRLMFDTALTVISKQQYSIYAIGGIGNAWNRISYRDADKSGLPCFEQPLNLKAATRSSFAWEAGAGLSYAFNPRVAVSLEYLYADLGKAKSSASGSTGITIPHITPAKFNLAAQSALLGLHIAF